MRVLAVDGNSILNRAFYGIRNLSTKDGRPTNGIYGFMNILLGTLEKYVPDSVCVAFDLKEPTFRHKMYSEYKAGRHPTPPELLAQFAPLKELLRAAGYEVIELPGYEADDILGTLSEMCGDADECYILTGDRDSLQLIRDNVTVLLPLTKAGQTVTTVCNPEKIREDYGVEPERMADVKAIMGDASDNIPGVKGIGEKGALELVSRFGTLGDIYAGLDTLDIKDSLREKLRASRESAEMSLLLGTICKSVPLGRELSSLVRHAPDEAELKRILADLEMWKLLSRMTAAAAPEEPAKPESKSFSVRECTDTDELRNALRHDRKAYFTAVYIDSGIDCIIFNRENELLFMENTDFSFAAFTAELFADDGIEKYTSDVKQLFKYCGIAGIKPAGIKLDTVLAGYLLNPDSSDYSLAAQSLMYKLPDITLEFGEYAEFADSHRAQLCDTAHLPAVAQHLLAEITENRQEKLLNEVEIPFAAVLSDMELEGFSVDRAGIESFSQKISADIEKLSSEIYEAAGEEFNISSPKQLSEVLFVKLGLRHGKKTKSGYSTDADTLEALKDENPLIGKVLEYRTLTKLRSTYCDGLLKVIDNDGRIHSTFNQTETRTGRISSSEPNLQNIPVRRELGREMRKFFVAGEGCALADADYSQIELRVLAAMAEDETMISAFNNNKDIHAITASQAFGVPLDEVTPLMRTRAKAVNFGIVYGIGAFSLAKDINVSVGEADRYIKGYLANYAGVREFMDRCKASAREKGYAETLFGRRRYLSELNSSNANVRAFGERVAMNMPIQGTAADILKIAMIRVSGRLKAEMMKSRIILQVHDEIIVESPLDECERAKAILREEMEGACDMSVRLVADVHSGKTWYDAKG